MKKKLFISFFVLIHLIFIFLHIYKNALFTQELFTKQRYEKELNEIKEQQETKKNELFALQNQEDVVTFARNTLGLEFINLSQIRQIS